MTFNKPITIYVVAILFLVGQMRVQCQLTKHRIICCLPNSKQQLPKELYINIHIHTQSIARCFSKKNVAKYV